MTVRTEDTVSLAAQMMVWSGVRHLPVLADEGLAGVVSERDILRHRARYASENPMELSVRLAMSAPAKTIHPDTPLGEAADMMVAGRLGCLPVLEQGRLVGIITTTDLLGEEARARFRRVFSIDGIARATAEDLMTPNPLTASGDDLVVDAVARMAAAGIRHLPVTDRKGTLVGMLCDRDVMLEGEDPKIAMQHLVFGRFHVFSVMQTDVPTVLCDCPIADLVAAFADWRVTALSVVDRDGRLLGIVSYVDLLRAVGQAASGPAARARPVSAALSRASARGA